MKIGYARVSTEEQNPGLRKNALKAAGCRVIIEDQGVSGAARERPGLGEAIGKLKKGDVLVVWRLDRLGRSRLSRIHRNHHGGRASRLSHGDGNFDCRGRYHCRKFDEDAAQ